MYWDQGFKRIWEYNPNIKIVVILRNPVERAYSHWNMETIKGKEVRDFSTLIRHENEISKNSLPDQNRIISYVDRGFYASQLRRMWRFFNKAQTFVIKYDDFRNCPERVMSSLFQFLELESVENINFENVYSQSYSSKMRGEDREYLRDVFYYEIKSLEKMLDWDCSDWISHGIGQ
ncbi:MAG: sulfotransferase domain-containing protein [Porticoccaceae bacterium]